MAKSSPNRYASLLVDVFQAHWTPGVTSIEFKRDELEASAARQNIVLPKNLGDVLYSFRYRAALPKEITATAASGYTWIIEGAGPGRYSMRQILDAPIVPRTDLVIVKIPDATPEIIASNALGDEQALLAKVRYNRLIDLFLGVTGYSLQNHLRTTVKGIGQIEIDEVYVAVDHAGVQYIIPVQAKGGSDKHSVVQTLQDMACCRDKFAQLKCRAVSAQFTEAGVIALFELAVQDGQVRVLAERHYQLVDADRITSEDLRLYETLEPL